MKQELKALWQITWAFTKVLAALAAIDAYLWLIAG